jgi:hypothetical protein
MTDDLKLSTLVSHLEEDKNKYMKRVDYLEGILQSKNQKIKKLELMLETEIFKSKLYCKMLEQHTNIKLGDIYRENEDGIHIYNYETGNIPVFVHDCIGDTKEYNITVNKKKTGKTFRTLNNIELADEKPQEQEEKLKKVEENIEKIVQENKFNVSVKETLENIEKIIQELPSIRIPGKKLTAIKNYRVTLLGCLNIIEYIKLIETHIKRIENIFLKKNSHDPKKTISYISLSLSSLEQRLVFYGSYYNTTLETDDIQRFKAALEVNMGHPTCYVPFLFSEVYIKIHNYSVAISSISEILKRVLVNPVATISNIIYLPVEKSTKEDPYSFYILESIGPESKRNWKLECRLDEFSKSLSQDMKTYCINLFRKIYFSIFNDNLYREDYTEKVPITSQDCAQLLENIIILSKQKSFCNTLRTLIIENCTIKPTKLDKFNFTADDKIIKRSFAQEIDDPEEIYSSIKRLFDGIDKEDIEKIISITH